MIYWELKRYGHHYLECDVTSHVIDSTTARNHIHCCIFQSAQMTLETLVKQIVGCDIQFGNLLAFYLNIGACREVEQDISRGCRLCIVGAVDVRLLQIVVESCGNL